MAQLNALDVCRLCLASAEKLGELSHHLTHIISTCFSLKILISSELTNKVCQVCVDQLDEVYKYRENIIKNELILLKELRKKYSDKGYSKCLLVGSDNDEVKEGRVRLNCDELICEMTIAHDEYNNSNVYHNVDTDVEKLGKTIIVESKNYTAEQKKIQERSGLKIQNLIDNKKNDNFNILDTTSELNGPHEETETNSNNADKHERKETQGLSINTNNLDVNEKPLSIIQTNRLELFHENCITLERNKENTDLNNFPTSNENSEQIYTVNVDRKFMCLTCLKVFGSQKELSIHYKTIELPKVVNDSSRKYSDSDIVKVSKNNVGKTVFKCGVCSKFFNNKTTAMKHTQVHKVDRPFLCNLCSRTYKTVADILRHGVVHNGFKFMCTYNCGYATVHLGALREHVKRHKKEYKYKCEKCGKCFQVKTWYDQHQNVHDKLRPFVCKLCGQAFSMARYLTAHRANVHPQSSKLKRYKCVQCALPCDSRKSLVMHMKQKHGMKTDCLCDVCGQILPDQQKLIVHRSVHEATRKFSCRFCKKTFNKKDHKTVHEKIHTGERLKCNNCPKSFTQRCSLRRHIKRYHQGDPQALEQKT